MRRSLVTFIKNEPFPIATLEDELVKDLQEETFRQYPVTAPDTKNSIIWHMWHMTRIEDMTMSVLVNNDVQVLHSGQWNKKFHIDDVHSGNEMTEAEIANLSATLDVDSLLAYRIEVGRNTREVISRLLPGDFKQKLKRQESNNLKCKAVKEEASWLLEYWGNKTIAGLVLMPATRHIFLHLNKSIRLKQKIQKSK